MCKGAFKGPGKWMGTMVALLLLTVATHSVHAQQLIGAAWQGDDLVLRLSDSAAYAVDIDESDTAHAVVRLWGVTPRTNRTGAIELPGPNGRSASISRNPPNELLVTLSGGTRFGCATLWHPYSRTLVVHTFRWEGLPYAQEQYYRALLAFEQNQAPLAISLLRGAHAAGERRATSALAAWYARRGENDLARLYLDKPSGPDDYAALESVQRAAGDTAAAAASKSQAAALERTIPAAIPNSSTTSAAPATASSSLLDSINSWFTPRHLPTTLIVGGGALLLIVLISVIVRSASRRARREKLDGAPPSSTSVHGVRVVPPVQEPSVPAAIVEEPAAAPEIRHPSTDEAATSLPEGAFVHPAAPAPSGEVLSSPESPLPPERSGTVERAEFPLDTPPEQEIDGSGVEDDRAATPAVEHDSAVAGPTVAASADGDEEMKTATIASATLEPERIEDSAGELDAADPKSGAMDIDAQNPAATETAVARSRQADELRRRIEVARSAPATELTRPVVDPTIAEARRADLSRDAVALRRRLHGDGTAGDPAR